MLVWQNYREKEAAKAAAEVPRPESRTDKAAAAGDFEDGALNLDFYKMLPNFKVVVPEKDREVSAQRSNTPVKVETPGVHAIRNGLGILGVSAPESR